ncbi:hypothetical protein LTR95_004076 [Oleoguttula sp. CCFEE 5521]
MAEPSAPVERACDRCRERRVKCDKRHPACFRCEKLGKPCPGYDKKRKFVDEGVTLRKKFETETDQRSNSGEFAELSLNSPHSTIAGATYDSPSSSDGVRRRRTSLHALPSRLGQNVAKPSTMPVDDLNCYRSQPIYTPPTALNQLPPIPSDMDIDNILNEVLDPLQFDPDWFNLEPDSFYGKNNNSCGFIPNLPEIVDEVDKFDAMTSIEKSDLRLPRPGTSQSLPWATDSQFHTSGLITDEREHEMAFLIRHFTESIGPWMDLYDCDNHFSHLVPLRALGDALLKNAIAAVAAKQLGRMGGRKLFGSAQCQKPALMEIIDDGGNIDWYYKAANYYDKAIHYSRVYLQQLSGSLSNPPSPAITATGTSLSSDDLLLAVSMFTLYESLDTIETGWLQHLTGMKSLLGVVRPPAETPQKPPDQSVGRLASFWNFARADYQAAYTNRTITLLNTEDMSMWRDCGLEVPTSGELYHHPDKIEMDPGYKSTTTELVSHTLLYLVLRIMNYLATPNIPPIARLAIYESLSSSLDSWHETLPTVFQPCAQLRRRPMRGLTPSVTSNILPTLTERFYPVPLTAATMLLYHFARITLLLNPPIPDITAPVPQEALTQAYETLGIAIGRPHPAVRVEMSLPLYAAGLCMESDEERKLVIELLCAVEGDTGVVTEGKVKALKGLWGWG